MPEPTGRADVICTFWSSSNILAFPIRAFGPGGSGFDSKTALRIVSRTQEAPKADPVLMAVRVHYPKLYTSGQRFPSLYSSYPRFPAIWVIELGIMGGAAERCSLPRKKLETPHARGAIDAARRVLHWIERPYCFHHS